jgi:hypothetical protein
MQVNTSVKHCLKQYFYIQIAEDAENPAPLPQEALHCRNHPTSLPLTGSATLRLQRK